ncbi:MAG: outer membrane beta-barrel protein [Rariglobus sp.]|nr:outer membrane beta-barrel protein [Rariglobus sp.]
MKHLVRNLSVLGCVGSSAIAAPFLAIGDNAELFVTADTSVAYNDNILLGAPGTEREDTILTFIPGFDLQFGKDSQLKGSVVGTATLTSYSDNSNFNNQLLGIGSKVAYQSGGVSLGANLSFNELDQPTVDVIPAGRLVEREVTNAGVNGEVELSEKISLGSGFTYSKTDYVTPGFTDSEEYNVPVNAYYELTPKVDVSAGVRYTNTQLDAAAPNEFENFYYNVGARGAFTPKLSGAFSVGYNVRTANAGPDDGGSFGTDASLAYAYTEKTQFTLALSRNYSNSSSGGASYENSQITLGASSAIRADWLLNAAVTYRRLDYQLGGQADDYIEGTVGATYVINSYLRTSLSYLYRDQSSNIGSEFTNNVVTLSLSARY